ncbi:BatD family protein [Vibrio sp. TBV020]|uniref:BatD family protein n=1 Tax=Vibrio sp. TBV020 TaxID=3137398 RepID=UPI0038CD3DEA
MKKHATLFLTSLCALLFALASSAALATNIQVTVSKNKVVKNEVFQLRVVVDKKVSSDAIDFSVLNQDFYVGRPSFGSSINIINGDRTTRSEWNISLAAQRLGMTSIPAFSVDGASSAPISIQVSADSDQPKVSDLVELQSKLTKSELFPKESATLTTRLIVKADPRRLQNPNITPPRVIDDSQSGLSLEALGEPNQYQSVLDGVEVTVVDQNYRVTANTAGDYTLKGIGFKGSVVYGDNRTGTTKLVSADTPAQEFSIHVSPIPSQYQGTWLPAASLSLAQRWGDSAGNSITTPSYKTTVGESLTREITLDIEGLSSEHIPNLEVNYAPSIRVYQEKPQFQELGNGKTRMTIKQVLIAQEQGSIELNDIALNWWDTTNKTAQTATLNGIKLEVAAGNLISSEPLSMPTVPSTTTETVTVYERGVWPYLTGLFAILWLITTVMLIRTRQVKPTAPVKVEQSSEVDQIIQALKHDDKVKANYLIKQWLTNNKGIEPNTVASIEGELTIMNQSQYGNESSQWKSTNLIKLIKKAGKMRNGAKKVENQLPPL